MINFNWEYVSYESDLKKQMEERFKDDLVTLLPERTKGATVIFQEYFQAIKLQGIITDNNNNKLFDFICNISNNYTTTYTDSKNNKITNKNNT